jgi:branched-chain amino acid transport system ATP-binding protein
MGELEVKKLSKDFGGLKALHEVDFMVEDNEVTGIIGPNGAGKSTLFNTITGFERPSSGEVCLDGRRINGLKPSTIAQKGIVRTWQGNNLCMDETVRQHLVVSSRFLRSFDLWGPVFNTSSYRSLKHSMNEKSDEIIQLVGLSGLENKLAGELTHGQQRLLGISMGLCCDPRILLLDEPFTGMNAQEIKLASEVLSRIMREKRLTLLIIEHNMKLVMSFCKRIIVLDYGVKIAEGSPAEVSTNKDVIQAYLGVPKNVSA